MFASSRRRRAFAVANLKGWRQRSATRVTSTYANVPNARSAMLGLLRMGLMNGSCVPVAIVRHHHPEMSRYQPIPPPPRKAIHTTRLRGVATGIPAGAGSDNSTDTSEGRRSSYTSKIYRASGRSVAASRAHCAQGVADRHFLVTALLGKLNSGCDLPGNRKLLNYNNFLIFFTESVRAR